MKSPNSAYHSFLFYQISENGPYRNKLININNCTWKKLLKNHVLHTVEFDHPNLPSEQRDRQYQVGY